MCDTNYYRIVVFNAASEAEARAIMDADPAVSDNVMSASLYPYKIAVLSAALNADSLSGS